MEHFAITSIVYCAQILMHGHLFLDSQVPLCAICEFGFGFVAHKTLPQPKRNDVDALL